jgi:hypothetical protein
MRSTHLLAATALLWTAGAFAGDIRGQYLEARTCDVYTGPCFANAEMGLAGKEALLAWKVEQGRWDGTPLDGLHVALVIKAENTLGEDGVFPQDPGKVDAVMLVDEQATTEQEQALVAFVKDSAPQYTGNVEKVVRAPMEMQHDYYTAAGSFQAGKFARIETRGLTDGDCVCTNEQVFYQPLTAVDYATPAYSLTQSFTGPGLDSKWEYHNTRSSFLATFER